jgi:hypothetical protein
MHGYEPGISEIREFPVDLTSLPAHVQKDMRSLIYIKERIFRTGHSG